MSINLYGCTLKLCNCMCIHVYICTVVGMCIYKCIIYILYMYMYNVMYVHSTMFLTDFSRFLCSYMYIRAGVGSESSRVHDS